MELGDLSEEQIRAMQTAASSGDTRKLNELLADIADDEQPIPGEER